MGEAGKVSLIGTALALSVCWGAANAAPRSGHRAMQAVPAEDPAGWFSPDDYPAEAIRAQRDGRVVVLVGIDSGGAVLSCAVQVSSGTALLDQKTCELALSRGRFNPATDTEGKPIATVYRLAVKWVVPDNVRPTELSKTGYERVTETETVIGEDGNLVSCRTIAHAPDLPDPCAKAIIGSHLENFVRDGRPVRVVTRQRFVVSVKPADPDLPEPK